MHSTLIIKTSLPAAFDFYATYCKAEKEILQLKTRSFDTRRISISNSQVSVEKKQSKSFYNIFLKALNSFLRDSEQINLRKVKFFQRQNDDYNAKSTHTATQTRAREILTLNFDFISLKVHCVFFHFGQSFSDEKFSWKQLQAISACSKSEGDHHVRFGYKRLETIICNFCVDVCAYFSKNSSSCLNMILLFWHFIFPLFYQLIQVAVIFRACSISAVFKLQPLHNSPNKMKNQFRHTLFSALNCCFFLMTCWGLKSGIFSRLTTSLKFRSHDEQKNSAAETNQQFTIS